MDDETFRRDTMLGIARIEQSLENLGERITTLEATCKGEDAEITDELRTAVKKLEEECNRKRKNLYETLTSADARTGDAIKETLAGLDLRVRVLEDRVLGVEKQSADKTTTRIVTSLESRIETTGRDIGEIKVGVGKLDTRLEAVEETIREIKDNGWKKVQTALTIAALVISILALSFNTLKELMTARPSKTVSEKQAEPDK